MAKDTSGKDNAYKIKLLRLWDILQAETDDEHLMSTQQLIARLSEEGIKCDRKVLARDIEQLNMNGYEVIKGDRIGHSNSYYVGYRRFDNAELRVLIDAVRAASFIPEGRSQDLIERIAELGGRHRAEMLRSSATKFTTRKHSNKTIMIIVDKMEQAIREKKQATFRYFRLDENGTRVYGHDNNFYVVNPAAMVYSEDFYYLVCWNEEAGRLYNYRIDRMEDADVLETDAVIDMTEDEISAATAGMFKMFGGETTSIELAFTDKLIPVMHDRFGEDIHIRRQENGLYTAVVEVQISPTFWGWLFQFAGSMEILSPDSAIKAYRKQLRRALKKDITAPDSPEDLNDDF